MEVLVRLPYSLDVRRKARSGCFGPFVSYEYFPNNYRSKAGRKGTKFKEKGGRKANREENTQHNESRTITTDPGSFAAPNTLTKKSNLRFKLIHEHLCFRLESA